MTPEQIIEAEELLGELSALDDVAEVAADRLKHKGFALCVGVYEPDGDVGGTTHAAAHLPLSMLDLILPELRSALTARLIHLGVKLPPEQING